MDQRLVAISDTHLGEDTSLLDYPEGRHRLLDTLRAEIGAGARIGELILVGDIPDRTLSSTHQIEQQTGAFLRAVLGAFHVDRIVYLPGNHDHTLWTELVRARTGGRDESGVTSPRGEALLSGGELTGGPACRSLLHTFFPDGLDGGRHGALPDFHIANPVYVPHVDGATRTWAFTHGTHFRPDVDLPRAIQRMVALLRIDRLAHLRIHAEGDVRKAVTLEELEHVITPFVDSMWPSPGAESVPASDELWFLLTLISGKFGHHRAAPASSRGFAWEELHNYPERFARLTEGRKAHHKSLARCERFFLGHLARYLARHEIAASELTLVYGDTHVGGWGELDHADHANGHPHGHPIRVFNTGSWVVHGSHDHPPCHLFCVGDDLVERFIDVSFAGVQSGGEELLVRAGRDVENRKARVGHLLKLVEGIAESVLSA